VSEECVRLVSAARAGSVTRSLGACPADDARPLGRAMVCTAARVRAWSDVSGIDYREVPSPPVRFLRLPAGGVIVTSHFRRTGEQGRLRLLWRGAPRETAQHTVNDSDIAVDGVPPLAPDVVKDQGAGSCLPGSVRAWHDRSMAATQYTSLMGTSAQRGRVASRAQARARGHRQNSSSSSRGGREVAAGSDRASVAVVQCPDGVGGASDECRGYEGHCATCASSGPRAS
jgi:hypothetical protein